MGANGVDDRGQLIPELPDALVLTHIIPRLPWYTRPLCRAISRSWRAKLDTRNAELDLRTRTIQLPLLRGLFLFCTFDKQIFIRDQEMHEPRRTNSYQIQPHWRRLPPLCSLVMEPPNSVTIAASCGMVYVWSNNMQLDGEMWNFVLKLDIGRADWTWNKFLVPYAFNSEAITFDSKIYVPGISIQSLTDLGNHRKVVLVHDMETDKCTHVDQDELRVLWRHVHPNGHVEEMYSLLEMETDAKLEILMYNAESDSWRPQERVSMPEVQWSHLPQVKLLNSDCFEPASEAGINIVWIDPESELLSCFSSSLGIAWVNVRYNPVWKGNHLEYIQFIRGSVYGMFCNGKEEGGASAIDEEEEGGSGGGLSGLFRRAIMKGRIIMASSSLTWEEVHEVGFFQEIYDIESSVIQPIDCYTLMG